MRKRSSRLSGAEFVRDCYSASTSRGKIEACFTISAAPDAVSGVSIITNLNKQNRVISEQKNYITPTEFKRIVKALGAKKKSHYKGDKIAITDYMD